MDIPGLAAAVDSQEHAAGVYAASVMMVDPPSLPEQIYLDTLARELGLEAGLAGEVHATLQAKRARTRRWRVWMNMRPDDMAHMPVLDKFKQQIIMLARMKALLDKSAMADR